MMLDGMIATALFVLGGIYWVQWSEARSAKDGPASEAIHCEGRLLDEDDEVLAAL